MQIWNKSKLSVSSIDYHLDISELECFCSNISFSILPLCASFTSQKRKQTKSRSKDFVSGCQKPSKINSVGEKKSVMHLEKKSSCLINIYPINSECNAGSRDSHVDGIPLSCIPVICGYYTVARHIDQNSGCSEFSGNFATDLRRARIESTDFVVWGVGPNWKHLADSTLQLWQSL